jgi:lysyl-tRNA synthetase class 2
LVFFHIESDNEKLQVLADRQLYDSASRQQNVTEDRFQADHLHLKRGDIVQVKGYAGKTKKGELSVCTLETRMLTPIKRDLPLGRGDGKDAVKDVGYLLKHRELDLLVGGKEARTVFENRFKCIQGIRKFLDSRDFIEVETPILWPTSGGAFAKPFQTTTRGLTLRISPELALKRLIIGGMERVYEIGKVFRDEGTSPRHNPEFTSIELYQAFANSQDLELFTREILQACYDAVNHQQSSASGKTRVTPNGVDFDVSFPRVSIADELEKLSKGTVRFADHSTVVPANLLPLLSPSNLTGLSIKDRASIPRLLDKLIGQEIESTLDPRKPTFLVDHPIQLSPLAKERPDRKGIVERFELFAGGIEICNAYSELNDPEEQRRRFAIQLKYRTEDGDEECQLPDEQFCQALELGLPPTAGWGMGIDRLVMMLLGKHSIREVILFPHGSS